MYDIKHKDVFVPPGLEADDVVSMYEGSLLLIANLDSGNNASALISMPSIVNTVVDTNRHFSAQLQQKDKQ